MWVELREHFDRGQHASGAVADERHRLTNVTAGNARRHAGRVGILGVVCERADVRSINREQRALIGGFRIVTEVSPSASRESIWV
ncbi:MAG: hypothetical protein JO168_16860 [Solirubrobacterales bacterium]|nr:hypothetical protein [Solirubrobacterales bacterium]